MGKQTMWMEAELRGGPLHGKVVLVTIDEDVYVYADNTRGDTPMIYRRRYSGKLAGSVFDFVPKTQLQTSGAKLPRHRPVELVGGPHDGEMVQLADDDERIESWSGQQLVGQYVRRGAGVFAGGGTEVFEWEGA